MLFSSIFQIRIHIYERFVFCLKYIFNLIGDKNTLNYGLDRRVGHDTYSGVIIIFIGILYVILSIHIETAVFVLRSRETRYYDTFV